MTIEMTSHEDLAAIVGEVRRFADERVRPKAEQIDESDSLPAGIYAELGELGALGVLASPDYGGTGLGALAFCHIVEEIAAASASVANALCVNVEIADFLSSRAPADIADEYVPGIVRGTVIPGFALTEPSAGSDVSTIQTAATSAPGGYLLNGSKSFITNALTADVFVVFARTGPGEGAKGLSAFLVPSGSKGLSKGRKGKFLGVRGLGTAELFFDDCFVPSSHRIGEEGQGFALAMSNLDFGRIAMGSEALGIAREALHLSLGYGETRQQFGRPVGHFQGIQFMLADMATSVQASRLLLHNAATRRDQNNDYRLDASMAKLFASDTAMKVATDAVQIFGAYGYSMESPVQRLLRDAKLTQIYEGSNQIQRWIIARALQK